MQRVTSSTPVNRLGAAFNLLGCLSDARYSLDRTTPPPVDGCEGKMMACLRLIHVTAGQSLADVQSDLGDLLEALRRSRSAVKVRDLLGRLEAEAEAARDVLEGMAEGAQEVGHMPMLAVVIPAHTRALSLVLVGVDELRAVLDAAGWVLPLPEHAVFRPLWIKGWADEVGDGALRGHIDLGLAVEPRECALLLTDEGYTLGAWTSAGWASYVSGLPLPEGTTVLAFAPVPVRPA